MPRILPQNFSPIRWRILAGKRFKVRCPQEEEQQQEESEWILDIGARCKKGSEQVSVNMSRILPQNFSPIR